MYVLSTQLSKLDIILGQSTSIQAPKRCCEIAETVENPGSLRRKSCRTATSGLDGLDGCRGRCSFVHNLQWLGVSSFGSTTLASKNGLSGEPILSLHGVGATNRKKTQTCSEPIPFQSFQPAHQISQGVPYFNPSSTGPATPSSTCSTLW